MSKYNKCKICGETIKGAFTFTIIGVFCPKCYKEFIEFKKSMKESKIKY